MSTIATGVFKKVTFKKQSAQGTIATGGAATGQALRRVTSTIDLNKAFYKSAEIRPSMQRSDGRHGVRSVAGQINGELSLGTYQQFFESSLRQLAVAAKTTGAISTITSAVTVAPAGTFTRSAGSYVIDGFTVGDVVVVSGNATPANNQNYIITALSATVMTVYPLNGTAVVAQASGAANTIAQCGKKTTMATTGQTRDYYTIEHAFSDITQSEQFIDCVVTGFNLKLPASGMATVSFPIMGLNMQTGTAAYFTSPTAATSTGIVASANGVLFVQGVKVGVITSLDLTVNGNYSAPGGVVGANVDPDIFPGSTDVSGTVTVMFDSATYRDMFVNETVASLAVALTVDNTATSGVFALNMPSLKFTNADKDDGEKGLTMTMGFTALENVTGTAGVLASTMAIIDSAFA
jgi:hypothetical protein